MLVLIIGVSGCGKSTIAKMLSDATGLPYYDADDYHPQVNIDKMSNGEPLTDDDRATWLACLSDHLKAWDQTKGAILACSALKEKYRSVLSDGVNEPFWVFLSGSFELIHTRMNKRKGHYMGADLLKSQFEDLEVPDYGLQIDIQHDPKDIIKEIMSNL